MSTDARNLMTQKHGGWGPGANVLGLAHTGVVLDVPLIRTGLTIAPVRVAAWSHIGTNAVVSAGVTIGRGAIVGAGPLVTRNVPPLAVMAGVPARFIRWRGERQAREEMA